MTAAGRAFLGAAFGALLTIALHPVSRPFLTSPLVRSTPSDLAAQLYLRSEHLPPPDSLTHSALWVHMAADRVVDGKPLRRSECVSVLSICEKAAAKEPKNAFWPQMRAVLLSELGHDRDAILSWRRAARCETWNDYQSDLLKHARDRIADLSGSHQAWQTAYVFYARSQSVSILIERFSRDLISHLDLESPTSLYLRYATLRNGSLMRNTGRSIAIGSRGADVVELASYPGRLSAIRSPKKLLLAQISMYNSLVSDGKTTEAKDAFDSFRENDAWRAIVSREDNEADTDLAAITTVFTAALPSAFLMCGLVGGLLWLLGKIMVNRSDQRFSRWGIATTSLVLGALTYLLSRNVPSAVVIGLCTGFLAYGPERGRSYRDEYVGPLFTFLTSLLSLAFFASFVLYVTGFSLCANAVLPLVGYSGEFFGNHSMFIGLSSIILGLLLLVAPAWSIVQRRSTPFMLSLVLHRAGLWLTMGCLALVVVTTPICIFWDRTLDRTFEQLVSNEPVYHFIR